MLAVRKQNFIDKANLRHFDKYDYSQIEYVNNKTDVKIICQKHGEFYQAPNHHLKGHGCSKCRQSKSEGLIEEFIRGLGFDFQMQMSYDECSYIKPLKFDFIIYTPARMAVEFHGKQHYEVCWEKAEHEKQKIRDEIKRKYCQDKGIPLLEIPYCQLPLP